MVASLGEKYRFYVSGNRIDFYQRGFCLYIAYLAENPDWDHVPEFMRQVRASLIFLGLPADTSLMIDSGVIVLN